MHLSRFSYCALSCALVLCASAVPVSAQFASDNVSLYAHLDLSELGGASNGNDCWGYVSGSGREYALMVVSNKLVVLEITDPGNPVIVGSISHTDTLWGDVKVYQDHAYVVNDNGGGGLDVVSLADVDEGTVTLIQRVTTGGLSTSHNVAIDEDSAYLYLCGADVNGGRLIAYSLADPDNPTFAGEVNSVEGTYVHDAEIVTYTSGPYAGQQIAFCANGGTGLDIYDVTAKDNMFRMSRTTYPNLSYAHQVWVSDDNHYAYLNDELDGVNETVIFDVSDLSDPQIASTYNSGLPATDHNLYLHNGFIFESDYRAGLRIFCAENPVNPVQVGWFDTYPEDDASGFDGSWSNYPDFPSGTAIISDINRGLFIVDPSEALTAGALSYSYPAGRPDFIEPSGSSSFQVQVQGLCGAAPASGTGLLFYDAGAGFVSVPMEDIAAGEYEAVFPAIDCGTQVAYYVSVEKESGGVVTDPISAPASTYSATSASGVEVLLTDNFEVETGWIPENLGASSGDWQRGVPVDDPDWEYDPATDGDGSGQCWLTQNELGNTDVDDGAVRLTSPTLDLTAPQVAISYDYYLRLTEPGDQVDVLLVEISENGNAGPWIEIARHDMNGGLAWQHHMITASDLAAAGVEPGANMALRFTANDADPQSIVEAGIDGFTISSLLCEDSNPADVNGDGAVNITDLLQLLAAWGPCGGCPEDTDGDGEVGIVDLLLVLAAWG